MIVLTDGVDLSINADNDTEGAKGLSQPSLANEFGTYHIEGFFVFHVISLD